MRAAQLVLAFLYAAILATCSVLSGCGPLPFTAGKDEFRLDTAFGSVTNTFTGWDTPQTSPLIPPSPSPSPTTTTAPVQTPN